MEVTPDQFKGLVRTALAFFGGVAVSRGWINSDQLALLSSDTGLAALGTLFTVGGGLWGLLAHRKSSMVASVAAMPEVAAVQTTATPAGAALAIAVPSPAVTVEGH